MYDPKRARRRDEIQRDEDRAAAGDRDGDVELRNMTEVTKTMSSASELMGTLLLVVAAISLVVGGVGIMNIMLVSVTERTREIGLRKAVGATDRDIMEQFLIESVVLTTCGGVVGIAFGALVVGVIYEILSRTLTTGWSFAFPISSVIMALAVSTISGLVFGIYPARKAAKKHPIDALRYE